jgi:hypothetical protein
MTAYQVIWEPWAWKTLRLIWMASGNKDEVDRAHDLVELALGSDPHRLGMPLSEGLWRFISPPLIVCFSIDTPQLQVVVSDVYETA